MEKLSEPLRWDLEFCSALSIISHHTKLKSFESSFDTLFLFQTDSAHELEICETPTALHVIRG